MNKFIKFFQQNRKMILLFVVCVTVNYLSLLQLASERSDLSGSFFFILIALIEFAVETALFIVIQRTQKKEIALEKLFLRIMIPMGLIFMLVLPIGRVPDEDKHFYRAYEISEGHLLSDKNENGVGGGFLPEDVTMIFNAGNCHITYNQEIALLQIETSDTKVFVQYPTSALYCFVAYIPQAIGIALGRLLNLPTLLIAYFGRLFNFAFFVAGIYYAIKLIPYKKASLIMICLFPMMMQEAVSLSADVMTSLSAIYMVAYVLRIKYASKEPMHMRNYIAMGLICMALALCKIVYLPLCFLLLLIPKERFDGIKKKMLVLTILFVFAIGFSLTWIFVSSGYLIEFQQGVMPFAQLSLILSEPLQYIQVFFHSIYQNCLFYFSGIVGQSLCWFDVNLSYWIVLLLPLLTGIVAASEPKEFVRTCDRVWVILSVGATVILIFTALYLQWTAYGSDVISGVQGRYFLPLLLPTLCLVGFQKKRSNVGILKYILPIAVSVDLYAASVLLFAHL